MPSLNTAQMAEGVKASMTLGVLSVDGLFLDTRAITYFGLGFDGINPFNPKLKKYILPTVSRELYKWDSENWNKNHLSIWVSYEKPSSSYGVM